MSNELIWQARKTSAPRPMTQAETDLLERIPTFAGQSLAIETITVKILTTTATVNAPDGTQFSIHIRNKQERELFLQAGYPLPAKTERGDFPLAATVIGAMVNEFGIVEMRIHTILHKDTGEPVTFAPVEPRAKLAPLGKLENKVDKSVYIYHEDAVTLLTAQEVGYGSRKIWKLECRADNGDLVRVEAWSEHNKMLMDAGYPALPETTAGKVTITGDVVLKYDMTYHAYRIHHVFPKPTEPALTVVEKPVHHVIAVTIDPSWEDEIADLRRKVYELSGMLDTQELPKAS